MNVFYHFDRDSKNMLKKVFELICAQGYILYLWNFLKAIIWSYLVNELPWFKLIPG